MRLDKYLNDILKQGRKDLHKIIKSGRVSVNGSVCVLPDQRIDETVDHISLDGKELGYHPYVYYIMNKPAGIITAMEDRRQNTIADILPDEVMAQNVFPVGRLDKDTTGLLLLTNDGSFAHRMISPKYSVEKTYYVNYSGVLAPDAEIRFSDGIILEDGTHCLPAKLIPVKSHECRVIITEGKYHQVKRMISAVGGTVVSLHREEIGGVVLDPALKDGEIRQLSEKELCILMTLI